jgi:prepilin peptidase CpaA
VSPAARGLPVNDMTNAQVAALTVAIVACVFDLRTRRIPNALTFGATIAALLYHVATGGFGGLLHSGAGWLLGVAIFIAPFALRGLGGGDVKLIAALGAWLGPLQVVWLALYVGVAGGVMAIVVALGSGYLRRALQNVWLLLCHWRVAGVTALPSLTLESSSAPKLAYAVPILGGLMVSLWLA